MNSKQAAESTGKTVHNTHIGKRAKVKSYSRQFHILTVEDGKLNRFIWDADNCKIEETCTTDTSD